jgi:hypothetical protein
MHIAPARNIDFHTITSPALQRLGHTATDVWGRLVRPCDSFVSVSTERLFGNLATEQLPELQAWLEYVSARYAWVRENIHAP